MKLNLSIQHIPFLEISCPPNLHDLKRAEDASQQKNKNKTFARWDLQKVERESLLRIISSCEVTYICTFDLERAINDDKNRLIYTRTPEIINLYEIQRNLRKKMVGTPQNVFGKFVSTDKLFLMDDIFKWSHHKIPWREVRTAERIIKEAKKEIPVKTTNA